VTRSIRKRQKQLRKQDKPDSPYAQSPNYWFREMRNRDRATYDIREHQEQTHNVRKDW
jgi:hypothetical protein